MLNRPLNENFGLVTNDELVLAITFAEGIYLAFHNGESFQDRKTGARAEIITTDKYQVLVWCGSNEPVDWQLNLTAIPWKYMNHYVHRGFLKHFKALWGAIEPHIDRSKPLYITGHSLGGAAAELSAFTLRDHPSAHLIAFGKPNVFVKQYSPWMYWLKTQISVVCGSDAITRVPAVLYGPAKAQRMLYFPNRGPAQWNPHQAFRIKDFKIRDVKDDHSIKLYSEKVRSYANHANPDLPIEYLDRLPTVP